MDAIECIKTRKSVREYSAKVVNDKIIRVIIESAIAAPSGKNGQPWKFKIITNREQIEKVGSFSVYRDWMKKSTSIIVVFLDKSLSYNYVKDVQSCGAAIQNMLLCSHALGIGSCWIGEILHKSDDVKGVLHLDNENLELMGMVSLGYSIKREAKTLRRNFDSFLL